MADQQKYTTRLQNSRILIIGGTGGLGYALAEACLEHGALVAISSSNPTRITSAVTKLQASYPSKASHVVGLRVDLSNPATLDQELAQLFEHTVAQIGGADAKLDHVIFTAGDSLAMSKVSDLSVEGIMKAGQIRFFAPLLTGKYVQKFVAPSHTSSYVITTGAISERPQPDWTVVGAYAGGHHAMVRQFALELKPIRVNGVSPGVVETDLWGSFGESERAQMFEAVAAKSLTGRIARADDVAETVLGLLKDWNVDGAVARTDGGSLIV